MRKSVNNVDSFQDNQLFPNEEQCWHWQQNKILDIIIKLKDSVSKINNIDAYSPNLHHLLYLLIADLFLMYKIPNTLSVS